MLAFLFLGAPVALIGVFIVSIRLILVILIWMAVFSNLPFFQDLTKILVDAAI